MIERYETGARMSQAVRAAGLVFIAGQVCPEPAPSAQAQTKAILASIDRLLAMAGSDRLAS